MRKASRRVSGGKGAQHTLGQLCHHCPVEVEEGEQEQQQKFPIDCDGPQLIGNK